MNKFITKLAKLFLGISMAAGVGVAIGVGDKEVSSVRADNSYTITFANSASSATSISSSTQAQTTIASASRSYVTTQPFTVNSGNCYYGDTQTCIRVGKSKNSGSLTIALSSTGQIKAKSFVVSCNNIGGQNVGGTVNVNSIGAQTSPDSQDDLTFTYTTGTTISDITLECSKAIRIYSIQVVEDADSPAPTTYTVTYNGNGSTGGTVPTDSSRYESGDDVTVNGNTGSLVKTNYNFAGWALNEAGTGTIYGPSYTTTYEISDNTTFYAKWTIKTLNSLRVVDGTPDKTSYTDLETFDPTGLTIYATLDNVEVETNVASLMIWGSLVSGETSVTGTYTLGEASKDVEITGLTITHDDAIRFKSSELTSNNNSMSISPISVASSNADLSRNAGYRLYQESTLTISTSGDVPIVSVEFTQAESGYAISNISLKSGESGSYSGGVWSGEASSIVFSMGAQVRVSEIAVKLKHVKTIEIFSNTIKEDSTTINDSTVVKNAMYVNDTFSVSATIVYKTGADYQDGQGTVTWGSTSSSVATIDSDGTITLVGNGNTTISATPNDGINAQSKVSSFTLSVTNIKTRTYVEVSDEIVLGDTGITGTQYSNWTADVVKGSGAKYFGNNAGGNSVLQFNSTTTSGLYTKVSPGKLYSVSVVWDSHTADSNTRKLYIYGTNTLPTQISDASLQTSTLVGEVNYRSPQTTSVTDTNFRFNYLIITGSNYAVYVSSITITWKVPGASDPMTAAPTLEVGSNKISVGRTTSLTVTTTPSESDEILEVTSSSESVATVSGTGKSYTITGVSEGNTTITVKGKQTNYQSSVAIQVVDAVQNEYDKVLTTTTLGLSGNQYTTNDGEHTYDAEVYVTSNVCVGNGLQFRGNSGGNGRLYNKYAHLSTVKAITIVMSSANENTITVAKGSSSNPDTTVSPVKTYQAKGVNTYLIGENYFAIYTTGSSNALVYIEKIIIELADNTTALLTKARSAASAILDGLNGLCGSGGSGVVSQTVWDSINDDIDELGLTDNALLYLKSVERICLDDLSQGGATIENAMAHYDACVTKFHLTPYTGITNAKPAPYVSPLNVIGQNTNTIAIIVIISMVSVTAIGGYFFLRKRKENN